MSTVTIVISRLVDRAPWYATLTTVNSILLILTAASFILQARRLYIRSSTTGISIAYAYINLIVATEQLAYGLHMITIDPELAGDRGIRRSPLNADDWLNIAQFAVVLLGHGIVFALIIILGPYRPTPKMLALVTYPLFVLITLVPYAMELTFPPPSENDILPFPAFFVAFHALLITPLVTLLAILAYIPQARMLRNGAAAVRSLSTDGLAVQAAVFLLVGVSWNWRLNWWPPMELKLNLAWSLMYWYWIVGWATVDNLIFAFVQTSLFGVARKQSLETRETAEEARPLLS